MKYPYKNIHNNTIIKRMSRELHNKLLTYPIFNKPQHYPESISRHSSYNRCYHELIVSNLESLIPNIDMGYREGLTELELLEWIRLAKEYSHKIHIRFVEECTNELTRLERTIQQKTKCAELDMNNITKLPDDIIRHIYDYLLPETKIDFLLEKRSDWKEILTKKLSVKQFKTLLSILYERYYSHIEYTKLVCIYDVNRVTCARIRYNNKPQALLEIERLLTKFRNAKPNTQENHRYFQTKSLHMLKLLIYLGYHYKKQSKSRR